MSTTYTESGVKYDVTTNKLLGAVTSWTVKITDPDGSVLYNGNISPLLGSVSTTNNSTLSIASALIGGTYVVPSGISSNINIAVSLLTATPTTIYIGGTSEITTAASALSGLVLNVDGGTASLNSGLIAGALNGTTVNITNSGTFSGGTSLITALSGTTINFGTGGGTFVLNAGSNLVNLSSTTITGYDPSKDTIRLENTTAKISGYTISGSGSAKTITLYGTGGTEIATYTATLAGGVTLANGTYNSLTQDTSVNPLLISYTDGNTDIGACFLSNTLIQTPSGEKAIEDLIVGDEIIAYIDGIPTPRRVIWAGQAHCTVRPDLPNDQAGYPVRIIKDAITDGVPFKDMLITAEHCLFFDGKFVPARMLVNGRSIFFDKSITSYDYYHIETEEHSIIMADGMLTESYLDTGNRRSFSQKGNVVSLTSSRNLTWDDAAAPLGVSREFAEPLFRQAEARAITAGVTQKDAAPELTEEANLHLITDTGVSIRPTREHNGRIMFMIPTGVQSIRIASNASRPSDVVGPFVDDRRYFGVAVGDITLFEGNRSRTIISHLTDRELDGWNTLEWEDCRWTSGNGLLPLGERHPNSVALIAIQIKKTGPYLATDAVQKKAALRA